MSIGPGPSPSRATKTRNAGRRCPDATVGVYHPIAQQAVVPGECEAVEWIAGGAVELPAYLRDQIRQVIHLLDCTRVSLFLNALSQICDDQGRKLFRIRDSDLVPDRRREPR
jgi:hypothetical protein